MMTPRLRSVLPLALLAIAAGCDNAPKKSAQAPIQTRETLGKTTQDIRKLEPELQKGAQVAPGKVTEKGYLAAVGNSYVVAMDKIAEMQIIQSIELYRAENDGKYPKDYDEFMDKVIKHYDIRLPMLPYYQEYSYDEKEHKLVVLEYPEKKAQRERERDAR